MKKSDLVQRIWRWTMRSLQFVLAMAVVVVGLNIWDDASQGMPFNWMLIAYSFGFFVFSGLIYISMRLVLKLVLAKVLHDERKSSLIDAAR